jgi:hypothetical protein
LIPPGGPQFDNERAFPFELQGYIENTTNVEYLKDDDETILLNALRVRLNLSGNTNGKFDFNIGYVGKLYTGATDIGMVRYLPAQIRSELIPGDPDNSVPGVDDIFRYNLENDNYLQEAFATLYTPAFKLRLGRQKFYTGTGYAYNPIDLFNPMDPLDPTYEVDGIDALLAAIRLPRQVELQGFMRFSDRLRTSDYLVRMRSFVSGWDVALQYTHFMKERTDWEMLNTEEGLKAVEEGDPIEDFIHEFRWHLIAGEFAGELAGVGIYAEGGYVFIEEPVDIGTLDCATRDHERFLVGADYTFDMQLYVITEYLRLGQGRSESSQISLNDRMAYYTGEILAINKNTLFTGVSYPLTDLTEVSLYGIIGCDDPSAIINPWVLINVYPGVRLSLTGYLPVGDEEGQNGRGGPGGFARLKFNF